MPGTQKLEIGELIQDMANGFERHRPMIMRFTIIFAVLNTTSNLLNVTGAGGTAISYGILLLLSAAYGGMMTALVCLPRPAESVGELWASVAPVLARLIWVTLITVVAVFAGLTLLIVPGLILLTLFAVATQVVVVERTDAFPSIGRSVELVRGNGVRVFLFILLLGLICLLLISLIVMVAVTVLGGGTAASAVANFLQALIVGPVLAIGPAVLYNRLAKASAKEPVPTEDGPL